MFLNIETSIWHPSYDLKYNKCPAVNAWLGEFFQKVGLHLEMSILHSGLAFLNEHRIFLGGLNKPVSVETLPLYWKVLLNFNGRKTIIFILFQFVSVQCDNYYVTEFWAKTYVPSTRIRIYSKTEIFFSVCTSRPDINDVFGHKFGGFHKRSADGRFPQISINMATINRIKK